jgi:hypothetical protein
VDLHARQARIPGMNRRELLTAAAASPLALALPVRAAARPVGGTPLALVTADKESHVVVLDLSTGAVAARIRTHAGPRSIEAVQTTWAVIAHTASGRLSILHAPSLTVRHVLGGFAEPRYTAALSPEASASVWAAPGRPVAFATDSRRREVVTVDVVGGRITTRTAVPGPARHVSSSPNGAMLWTALGSKAEQIAVLEVGERGPTRLVRTIRPPAHAHDVVFAPDGRHVWVTSGVARRLWVYELDGRRPVAELAADAPPQHVAFVGGLAFVASGDSGTVRVHRPDGMVVHESAVPLGSYNVTYGWQRAVTPSLGRGTVALLDRAGRVDTVRRVARAAHDACVVVGV